MYRNRRWLMTASGAAVMSEILSLLVGSETRATSLDAGSTDPAKPASNEDWKTIQKAQVAKDYDSIKKVLERNFLQGTELGDGGLNPPGEPPLAYSADLLKKVENIYRDRVKMKFLNEVGNQHLYKVPSQAAALGLLTRCMCLKFFGATIANGDHLEAARDGLGFALGSASALKDYYKKMECKPLPISVKEPDQPCALC